jgi:branched-chain amino acid transport system permease protein
VYALLGISFGLILGTTKRFHFAYVASFAVGAYATYWGAVEQRWPFAASMIFALVAAMAVGVASEVVAYEPVERRARGDTLIPIFVASLGITIAVDNGIQMRFGSNGLPLSGLPVHSYRLGPVAFTSLDVMIFLVAWVCVIGLSIFLRTVVGSRIRAVQGNPELAEVVGIGRRGIHILVFAIGSGLAGVVGILWGSEYALTPTMGLSPVFSAFVVVFVAGSISSPIRFGMVGLIIGLIASLSGIWLSARWQPLVVFSILIAYLVVRSMGFRGVGRASLLSRRRVHAPSEAVMNR